MPSRTRLLLLFAMKKTLALLLLLAGLSVEAQGRMLTWTGAVSDEWNTTTANWLDEAGNAAVFQNGDDVVFNDFSESAHVMRVMLTEDLAPASVRVDTSWVYEFNEPWSGSLTGSMQLVKYGSGTLHIRTYNDFWDGSTVLNEGTITINSSHALGEGEVTLNGGTLALESNELNNKILLQGSVSIGNGTINGDLAVGESKSLTLLEYTTIMGSITLGDDSMLNLGENTISQSISLQGSATLGNGTIASGLAVAERKRLTLLPNTAITGGITLGDDAMLNLGGNTISGSVSLQGSASIGNGTIGGTINGNLVVAQGMSLSLQEDTTITGGITLRSNAFLHLGQNTTITGDITLGGDTMLNLGENTISHSITVQGLATLGNGTIASGLAVAEGTSLALLQNTAITGGITLGDDAGLDLGQNTISGSVSLQGSAFIGNGVLNSNLAVAAGKELWLNFGNLTGSGTINLGNGATLLVGNGGYNMGCGISGSGTLAMEESEVAVSLSGSMKDFTGSLEVQGGTLNLMNIAEAAQLNVADVAIMNGTLGVYKGGTAAAANEGTLTISNGHTLTAGLEALLNADLVMGGGSTLDVSAAEGNGGLEMGSTVTLDPGNVLLSDADMDAIGELGFMGKYDLFNGVDSLTLGDDFLSELGLADKWVKAGEVFANEQFQNPEREYYLFYSGASQGGAGGNVGTVYLMQIPEPATGTLSLLALAALAARRRRK